RSAASGRRSTARSPSFPPNGPRRPTTTTARAPARTGKMSSPSAAPCEPGVSAEACPPPRWRTLLAACRRLRRGPQCYPGGPSPPEPPQPCVAVGGQHPGPPDLHNLGLLTAVRFRARNPPRVAVAAGQGLPGLAFPPPGWNPPPPPPPRPALRPGAFRARPPPPSP